MGLKMYFNSVNSNTKTIDLYMDSVIFQMKNTDATIQEFVSDNRLQGAAYNQSKTYFASTFRVLTQGVLTLAKEMKTTNKTFISGYQSKVDDSGKNLIEEELIKEIARANSLIKSYNNALEDKPKSETDKYTNKLKNDMIKNLTETKKELEKKLNDFREYNSSSAGLYNNITTLVSNLAKGIKSVSETGGWNKDKGYHETEGMDLGWAKGIKDNFVKNGIGKKGVANLKKLGYTDNEIYDIFSSSKTDEDRKFMKLIAEGDYEAAFTIKPDNIKEGMDVFMADYSSRLAQNGDSGLKELEKFSNSITNRQDLNSKDIQKYLEKLYLGSSVLLLQEKGAVDASSQFNDAERKKILERFKRFNDIATFWGSQGAEFDKTTQGQFQKKNGVDGNYNITMKIKNLELGDKGFIYDSSYTARKNRNHNHSDHNYSVSINQKDADINFKGGKVNAYDIKNNTQYQGAKDEAEFKEFEKERQKLLGEYLTNLASSTLSAYSPIGGAIFSMFNSSSNGDTKGVSDSIYDSLKASGKLNSNSTRDGFMGALGGVFKTYDDLKSINAKEYIKNKEIEIEWFGSYSGNTVNDEDVTLIHSSEYDPESTFMKKEWEKDGIEKYLDKGKDKDKKTRLDYLKEKYPDNGNTDKYIRTLIYGNKNTKISFNDMSMKKFQNKINQIDRTIDRGYNGGDGGHSTKESFRKKRKEKNKNRGKK